MPDPHPDWSRGEAFIDEARWQRDVTDLHRIVDTMKTVWLSIQHANEPVVRVALELVCSKYGKGILSWPHTWWPDEEKRKLLKGLVHSSLKDILRFMKPGEVLDDDEQTADDGEDALAVAQQRALAWEERFNESEQARAILEVQLANALRDVAAANAKAEEFEQSLKKYREEIKQLRSDLAAARASVVIAPPPTSPHSNPQEEEDRLRNVTPPPTSAESPPPVKQGSVAAPVTHTVVKQIVDHEKVDKLGAELAAARRTIDDHERKIADLERRLKEALSSQGGGIDLSGLLAEERDRLAKELDELRSRLQALLQEADAAKARVAELETRLRSAEAERDDAIAKAKAAEAKAAAAEAAAAASAAELAARGQASVGSTSPSGRSRKAAEEPEPERAPPPLAAGRSKADEELLAQKDEEIAKLKDKVQRQKHAYGELEAEKEDIESKRMAALRLIRQLREQMKALQELAHRRGLGAQVAEIMAQCGLGKELEEQIAVFERLWQDALRRIEKYRRIEELISTGGAYVSLAPGGELHGGPPYSVNNITSNTVSCRMAAAGEPCPMCSNPLSAPLRLPTGQAGHGPSSFGPSSLGEAVLSPSGCCSPNPSSFGLVEGSSMMLPPTGLRRVASGSGHLSQVNIGDASEVSGMARPAYALRPKSGTRVPPMERRPASSPKGDIPEGSLQLRGARVAGGEAVDGTESSQRPPQQSSQTSQSAPEVIGLARTGGPELFVYSHATPSTPGACGSESRNPPPGASGEGLTRPRSTGSLCRTWGGATQSESVGAARFAVVQACAMLDTPSSRPPSRGSTATPKFSATHMDWAEATRLSNCCGSRGGPSSRPSSRGTGLPPPGAELTDGRQNVSELRAPSSRDGHFSVVGLEEIPRHFVRSHSAATIAVIRSAHGRQARGATRRQAAGSRPRTASATAAEMNGSLRCSGVCAPGKAFATAAPMDAAE